MFFNRPFYNMPPKGFPQGFNMGNTPYMNNTSFGSFPACGNFPVSAAPNQISGFMENAQINRPFENEAPHSLNISDKSGNSLLADGLSGFMQNEKNAVKYYKNLGEKAYGEKSRKILHDISRNAGLEIDYAKKLSALLNIKAAEPEERAVNCNISFPDGISLAIEEENNALNELSRLLEADSASLSSQLTPFMIRKLSRLNYLYFIHNDL